MLKVAILSYWHVHAWDYTRQVQARSDCQIVAVWDEIPSRGKEAAEQLQVTFYDSLETLLQNPEIDAVVVVTPTNIHPEVMVAAAKAGKHIFTEKVLAITNEGCEQIIDAVDDAGVKLMVSLPRLTESKFLYVKQVIEQGLLGQVTLVRTRLAHDGALPNGNSPDGWLPAHFLNKEQCGGGALIDLGCHPMYLAHYYLGMPSTVTTQYGYVTGREVEDNAVSVLGYDNGAIAVVEAGFASQYSPFQVEVYGTEGCLLAGNTIQLRSKRIDLELNDGWIMPDRLPKPLRSALNQWVEQILYDTTPEIGIESALALTRLMEASNRSAGEGKAVKP